MMHNADAETLARLLASEGALVAVSQVPEGVRDVLRRARPEPGRGSAPGQPFRRVTHSG